MVIVGWGLDAWRLAGASAELPWFKLLVASLTLVPLASLTGALAGRVHPSVSITLLLWVGYGTLGGWVMGHLQFDALRIAAGLIDPATDGLPIFPYTSQAQFLTGVAVFLGIVVGFPAGFFQVITTDWAWDRSTAEARMTWSGCAMLIVAVLLGLGQGLFDDSIVNGLTAPILLTNRVIQVALQTPTDLDTTKMTNSQMFVYVAGLPWREIISPRYTLYLVDYEPDIFQEVTLDIAFDSGVVLRCSVIQARFMSGCFDASAEFGDLIKVFVKTGTTPCSDCSARALPVASSWQSQHRGELGEPTRTSVTHHSGSAIRVQVDYSTHERVDCYLFGNEPVVIERCTN